MANLYFIPKEIKDKIDEISNYIGENWIMLSVIGYENDIYLNILMIEFDTMLKLYRNQCGVITNVNTG